MKKRVALTLACGLAGAAGALIPSVTGSDVMTAVLKPFTLLGELLRAWSLSGAAGNAAAWAVLAAGSLLPVVWILRARRKRKEPGDWLFLLTGAVVFGGLFLLVNPTLYVHPALTGALEHSPGLLTGGPVFAMLSILLLSVVVRWSGGLMRMKKQEDRLIFWTKAILTGSMALIAFSACFALTDGLQAAFGGAAADAWAGRESSVLPYSLSPSSAPADGAGAAAGLLLTVILLIPDMFSVRTLNSAVSLVSSMKAGFFSSETDEGAAKLSVCARHSLIATVGCMAARNLLIVALAQWIPEWTMSFSLPLDDLLISCGAMLLARLFSAACRVKRDNDLMI